MRSMYRKCFLVFVTALALGATTAASASASSWWVAGQELGSPSAELASTAKMTSPITLYGLGITVECGSESLKLTNASISSTDGGKIEHLLLSSCHTTSGSCSLQGTTIETKPLTVEAALGGKARKTRSW
jgi:hypothetical protein